MVPKMVPSVFYCAIAVGVRMTPAVAMLKAKATARSTAVLRYIVTP
jgi:hypothetical protein